MDELELITEFRSHVEPPDAQRVEHARQTLAREIARAPSRPVPRPAVAALVVVPTAALAAAALLVAGAFSDGGASSADAAIIHRADDAMTPPPNAIFHTALVGEGFEVQRWQLTSPPYSALSSKGPLDGPGNEVASSGSRVSSWDPATNTIHQQAAPAPQQPFDDELAQVRTELDAGRARVLGTATIDGKPTYEIQFGRKGQFDPHGLVAFVDQTTYRPLALSAPQRNGSRVRLRVTAFEYLPTTEANMRLLSLSARHPDARVVADRPSGPRTK